MTRLFQLLLLLAVPVDALAVELKVSPQPVGQAPKLFGYNAGHFTPGSNTADWWRYSGVNAARVWSPPDVVEQGDDNSEWGDGVRSAEHFAARRKALRGDPLNAEYINWEHFNEGFGRQTPAGNRMQLEHAFSSLVGMGVTPLAVISRSNASHPFAEPGTAEGWRDRWEHWQHFYAQAFYLARRHGVERFHAFNEPDHHSQDVSQSEYLERVQLASDAIQSAVEDVNRLFRKALTAQVQAPVSAGSVGKFTPTPGGDPRDDATGWGQLIVENLDSWHPGVGGPTYPLVTTYAYQQYNATGARFGSDLAKIKQLIARSKGSPELKVALTEYNVHTARTFSGLEETLDTPSKAARLGAILAELAKHEPDELYVFKFSQTNNFGNKIKKNGVHYADNFDFPFDIGGVTRAGEAVRLFAKGFAGEADLLRVDGDGGFPEGFTAIASRRPSGETFVLSVNESQEPERLSVDLSRLGIPAGAMVTVEEVSDARAGEVSQFSQLPAAGVVVLTQPAGSVLLVSASSTAAERLTLSATDDAMVKSGVNADENYGASENLRVKSHPANPNARNASFIKFSLGNVDRSATDRAVLLVSGVNEGSAATVTAHVYGLLADDWNEDSIAWESAPNLGVNDGPHSTIADNYVEGVGEDAFFLGHVTATQEDGESMIDVSDFVREHPNDELTFLVTRELRIPGEDVDDALSSLRLASRESSEENGPQLLLAVPATPGDR